jgi:methanogenic corrinoid protein MtbC1
MVADCLELDGWDVHFTGANTPIHGLDELLSRTKAHVLGIGPCMSVNIHTTRQLIVEVRRRLGRPITVIVGGRAYAGSEKLWRSVGADCFASDAVHATALLHELAP